jgi:hypothetical protein
MKIRFVYGALVIGALWAIAVPANPSLAQSSNPVVSAPQGTATSVTPWKHRYWRHRGGRHPHYGSRRVRS